MQIELQADLEGTLKKAPAQQRSSMPLRIVDSAACFVAPKTSYFVASDLSLIGARGMQGRLQKQLSAGAEADVAHELRQRASEAFLNIQAVDSSSIWWLS